MIIILRYNPRWQFPFAVYALRQRKEQFFCLISDLNEIGYYSMCKVKVVIFFVKFRSKISD